MTLEVLKDKTLRVLPTLTIDRVRGGFKITLQDHASRQQCSAEAETVGDLWQALEHAMIHENAFRYYKSRRVTDVDKRKELKDKA